jgi:hypothetical protein
MRYRISEPIRSISVVQETGQPSLEAFVRGPGRDSGAEGEGWAAAARHQAGASAATPWSLLYTQGTRAKRAMFLSRTARLRALAAAGYESSQPDRLRNLHR